MGITLMDRARKLASPGYAAALAIIPLASVAARPARGQPAMMFGLSNASINGNPINTNALSGGSYNSTSQNNGSINITGAAGLSQNSAFSGGAGSVLPSGGSFFSGGGFTSGGGSLSGGGFSGGSSSGGTFEKILAPLQFLNPSLQMGGGFITLDLQGTVSIDGTVSPSDVVNALMSIDASSTGGVPLTYEGAMLSTDDGTTNDFNSPPLFTGTSFTVNDLLSLPADEFATDWDLQMSFYWPDSNPNDTVSIGLPVSLGEDIPVPEPASAGLIFLPMAALIRRRRRRAAG